MAQEVRPDLARVLAIMRQTGALSVTSASEKDVAIAQIISGCDTYGARYGMEHVAGCLRIMAATYEVHYPVERPDNATVQ